VPSDWPRQFHMTDPYGLLEYAIGSEDDFICFDFLVLPKTVVLHSVLNSETGHFIQDFYPPQSVAREVAASIAKEMCEEALSWCGENEVEHDTEGWNQDPMYFARCVEDVVSGVPNIEEV